MEDRPMSKYPTHKRIKTKPFSIYDGIKSRCYNPSAANYKSYGAKGVTMCDEWKNDFQAFAKWYVQECESLGLDPENHNYQVDKDELCIAQNIEPRIYSPDTCKLVLPIENMNISSGRKHNTTHTLLDPNGESISVTNLRAFCDTHSLSYNAMRNVTSGRTKQHQGYSLEDS